MSQFFDPALGELTDALPSWWATQDTRSQMFLLIDAIADEIDEVAAQFEQVYTDNFLATASAQRLIEEYARVWGIDHETLPSQQATLRAYIQARIAEDGSVGSLRNTLLALLETPANLTGTVLIFPGGGGGLTFPADGSGLLLFQGVPDGAGPLTFDPAGGGLTFPGNALTFPLSGSGLTFDAGGAGITFPILGLFFPTDPVGWVLIQENTPTAYSWKVTTKSFLAFDRAAFQRALARFRQSGSFAATYVEVNS